MSSGDPDFFVSFSELALSFWLDFVVLFDALLASSSSSRAAS